MCNMDCFHCTEPDCTNDDITETEKREINFRDIASQGFGIVRGGRHNKARNQRTTNSKER